MKKIARLTLLIVLLASNVQAQRIRAVSYMNVIEREFNMVQENMWYYTNAASHQGSAGKLESKRKELIKQIELSIRNISGMKPFQNSTRYRDSAVAFLQLNYQVLKDDFATVLQLQTISEKTYQQTVEYIKMQEVIDTKLAEAGRMMNQEQVNFGTLYGIAFTEKTNQISLKQAETDKVYDYYNPIYLCFLKSYLDEVKFVDTQTKQDSAEMEQYSMVLLQNAREGLTQLQQMDAFKGDTSLKAACMQMLQFYELEVAEKFTHLKSYYAEKKLFAEAKNKMELIHVEQRTNEDVKTYNQAVSAYNLATSKFNVINQYLNETRNKLIANWNASAQLFKDTHVPKR